MRIFLLEQVADHIAAARRRTGQKDERHADADQNAAVETSHKLVAHINRKDRGDHVVKHNRTNSARKRRPHRKGTAQMKPRQY